MTDELDEAELEQLETDMKKANKFFEDSTGRFDRLEGLMEAILQKLDKLDRKMESSGNSSPPLTETTPMDSSGSDSDSIPDLVTTLAAKDEVHPGAAAIGDDADDPFKVEVELVLDETEQGSDPSLPTVGKKLLIDPSDESRTALDSVKGEIEPRHISFKYPSRPDIQIFRELSLAIHFRQTVTLVGESRSGKSAMISSLVVIPPICSRILNSVNLSLSASDSLQVPVSLHFIFIYDPGPRISSHFSLPSSHIIEGKMHTWYLIYCFRDPSAFPEIYLSIIIVVTCEPGLVKRACCLYVIAEIYRILPLQSVYCIGTIFSHLDSGLEEYRSYGGWKLVEAIYPIIQNKGCCSREIPAATNVDLAMAAAWRALVKNENKHRATASGSVCACYLRAMVAKVMERKSELAKLEAIDCGKSLDEALWDMDDVAGCFEYYADLTDKLNAKQKAPISLSMQTFTSHVLRKPIGVVALITPWNYPLLMAVWKVAPALATGCTTILKPSELAAVTCLELRQICRNVGLPLGVLNVLIGLGPTAGAPLASHPHVDKIAFTGSTMTGSKIWGGEWGLEIYLSVKQVTQYISCFIAYLETLAIFNFPCYQSVGCGVMCKVGSLFYAIYFIVCFPTFLRIEEKFENKWDLTKVTVDALGVPMLVTIIFDLWPTRVAVDDFGSSSYMLSARMVFWNHICLVKAGLHSSFGLQGIFGCFFANFPNFDLEDKVNFPGGSNVMNQPASY